MNQMLKKKAFFIVCMLVTVTCASGKTSVIFKPGSKLIYTVNFKGKMYDFVVTIKKLSPDIVFSYDMTAPANKKGVITIPEASLDSARELYNYFNGGAVTLKNQTTVFLSRKIFAELTEPGGEFESSFKPSTDEPIDHFGSPTPGNNTYLVNGEKTELPTEWIFDHVDSAGSYHYTFTILNNPDFPLIMNMDIGWTISLKAMQNVDVIEEN